MSFSVTKLTESDFNFCPRASDPPFSGALPLLSMELTQNPTSLKSVHKEEAKRGVESFDNSKEKRRFGHTTDAGGLLPTTSGDQDIVELVLGRAGEPKLGLDGVYTELSSEEEEEGGRGMSDDFSMNESDYPLRSASLLHKLLYSDPGQIVRLYQPIFICLFVCLFVYEIHTPRSLIPRPLPSPVKLFPVC